jgi:hypothetical protein
MATAKKSSTTKKSSPAKQSSTAKKSSAPRRSGSAPRAEAPKRPGALQVGAHAAQQLGQLTGKQTEGVTGLERSDEGWTVEVEVVEVRRIPDTTDVLALYEVVTDADGELQSYRRLRRYTRGAPGDE